MEEGYEPQIESRSVTNERQPPSEEILQRARERRKRWLEDERAFNELQQAKAVTPEEARRREELLGQIFERLGVREELEELRDLLRARERRVQEVIDNHTPPRGETPGHDGGR